MKKTLPSLLAFALGLTPSFAQSPLILVIDKDSQQIDWLAGSSISTLGTLANNWFGNPLFPNVTITAPTLNYLGDGSLTAISFQVSGDRTQIEGISLGTSLPPLSPTVFSGTDEGPAAPTFTLGNFSMFSQLSSGEYTLAPFSGGWSAGIQVVVVPEPSTWMFLSLALGAMASLRLRRSSRLP